MKSFDLHIFLPLFGIPPALIVSLAFQPVIGIPFGLLVMYLLITVSMIVDANTVNIFKYWNAYCISPKSGDASFTYYQSKFSRNENLEEALKQLPPDTVIRHLFAPHVIIKGKDNVLLFSLIYQE